MSTTPSQDAISGIREAIVDYVVNNPDDLADIPAITRLLASRTELIDKRELCRIRHQQLIEAKLALEPLFLQVTAAQQELATAQRDLATLEEAVGTAVFAAFLAGEISEQACFSERYNLQRTIELLQSQHDGLATGTDAGLRQRVAAKAKQTVVLGKLTLKKRLIQKADTSVGHAIITSEIDDSVRCDTTTTVLDQVAQGRDSVGIRMTKLDQADTDLTNVTTDLCKLLSLSHIAELETLDNELTSCLTADAELVGAIGRAGESIVETLNASDSSTLPTMLEDQLKELAVVAKRHMDNISNLNTHALANDLCPFCGVSINVGYATCYACNNNGIAWVESTKVYRFNTFDRHSEGDVRFGPCLVGQETVAISTLDAWVQQSNEEDASARAKATRRNLLILLFGAGLIFVFCWFVVSQGN